MLTWQEIKEYLSVINSLEGDLFITNLLLNTYFQIRTSNWPSTEMGGWIEVPGSMMCMWVCTYTKRVWVWAYECVCVLFYLSHSRSIQAEVNQKSMIKTRSVRAGYLFMSTLRTKRKVKLMLLSEPMLLYEALSSTLLWSRMARCTRYRRKNISADSTSSNSSHVSMGLLQRHSGVVTGGRVEKEEFVPEVKGPK